MAYAVDAVMREQARRDTADKEGEDDGGAWLSSKAAQRMSLANPETAHVRTVVSKFGGTFKQGTAVAIPTQTWDEEATRNPFEMSRPDSFRNRSPPTHVIVGGNIPGYTGHRPHAAGWNMPHRRADREAGFLKPMLVSMGQPLVEYPAQPPHDTKLFNMPPKNAMPRRMPTVGYMGHVPGTTGNSVKSFGTSHWRKEEPVNRAEAARQAFENAQRAAAAVIEGYEPPEDSPFAC